MSIEGADYINELDPTWPKGGDGVSEGDDHIRQTKHVLQETFPNLTGPVTATQDDLNNPGNASGSIMMFGGSTAPTGYLLCNGAAVSRTTYSDLYLVVTTLYGEGDGSTTFNLPDMRDKTVGGVGTNSLGSDAGKDTWTSSDIPSHNHTSGNNGNHTHDILRVNAGSALPVQMSVSIDTTHNVSYNEGSPLPLTEAAGNHNHTINSTGSGGDNRQATIYINYIIKT